MWNLQYSFPKLVNLFDRRGKINSVNIFVFYPERLFSRTEQMRLRLSSAQKPNILIIVDWLALNTHHKDLLKWLLCSYRSSTHEVFQKSSNEVPIQTPPTSQFVKLCSHSSSNLHKFFNILEKLTFHFFCVNYSWLFF